MNYHALCFVDMPFGQKSDLKSAWSSILIKSTTRRSNRRFEQSDLEALRWDERTGGIIHSAMFGQPLLPELVVADLTLAKAQGLERIVLTARLGI